MNTVADGRRGAADLVAYLLSLRAWNLLRDNGGFGLLAVNTIAEGDTRQVGLEAMVRAGAVIYSAYPNEPWPGTASVITCRIHVRKGVWDGERSILGRAVPFVSAYLSGREEWSPRKLRRNAGLQFEGSKVNGMGFVLAEGDAKRMMDADAKNADVIFPYLNGEDLNSDPEQHPSRWIICFWDWSENRKRAPIGSLGHGLRNMSNLSANGATNEESMCSGSHYPNGGGSPATSGLRSITQ